ncbi:MAG: hypothetical protein ACP5R5_14170, partial [Armatimonadota bacterium]
MPLARVCLAVVLLLASVCPGRCAGPATEGPIPAEIDDYVSQTPPEAAASIESLAAYLVKNASTEMQKARAIY